MSELSQNQPIIWTRNLVQTKIARWTNLKLILQMYDINVNIFLKIIYCAFLLNNVALEHT